MQNKEVFYDKNTNKTLFFSILALIGTISTAFSEKNSNLFSESKHNFEVGLEGNTYQYKEKIKKKRLMSEFGPAMGINFGYKYNFGQNFFKITERLSVNNHNYKSKGTGKRKDSVAWYTEKKAFLGRNFDLSSNTILSPYIGLGYRFLRKDTTDKITTTGHYGYLRESRYLFLPIGFDLSKKLSSNLYFVANTELDILLKGQRYSGIGNGIKNDQDAGIGGPLV